ncbi:MAG: hypothetical protein GQE15_23105 [Archangiaceae bacterium]|nr:hypothetical protein [Archangiaceae bacterium]
MTTRVLWLLLVVSACKAEPRLEAPKFPSKYAVHGIDVSRHNGAIDWSAVASAGVNFAWVKASEGADVRAPRFIGNVTAAEAPQVRSGPYHFFTFCRPGASRPRTSSKRLLARRVRCRSRSTSSSWATAASHRRRTRFGSSSRCG